MNKTGEVGRSIPRLEARAKVTGRARYAHHFRLPGMLYGKIFRSTIAHGYIRSLDVSAARSVEGVHAVITGKDILSILPDPYYGPAFFDQPVLAQDKVRYVGEPVAVVLAADAHVAERATELIEAEYDEIPAVFDEIEAMTSAAIVHDELKPAGTLPDLRHLAGVKNTNVALKYHVQRGDPERAFSSADHVFEHTFRTQQVMHTPLEPIVAVAEPEGERITVYTSTQSPSAVRMELARLLGWDQNQVRIKVFHLGGGFGSKLYIKLEALVSVLALMTRRPVKIALTMAEQFFTITRHACTFRIKSGVMSDGRIVARRCEIAWNGGAYADISPRVAQKAFTAAGPYDIDNVQIDSYAVYTNRTPAGAMRGFGLPQMVWAHESHTDIIARTLKIDPIDLRRKNILTEGRPQAVGTIVHDAAIEQVLERLAQTMEWGMPFDRGAGTIRRGRGIALGFKASVSPTTSTALLTVNADGSYILSISTVDMGQGSDTVMAQIVAEVMNIPAERVRVVNPDTDVTPYDMATLGSRSAFHMGHAVRLAAEDALVKLKVLAREANIPDGADIRVEDIFYKRYRMQAGSVVGFGSYMPSYTPPDLKDGSTPNITPFWPVSGTGIDLEVDTETGRVWITRMINVADAGVPLNPKIVETQLSGAAIMHLGFTLFEKMEVDAAGQVTNPSFAEYKIPGILDVPLAVDNILVQAEQHNGPFGAKGVGESGAFCVAPAIANALHDAIDVRITQLPLTPEVVYRALRAHQNEPLTD